VFEHRHGHDIYLSFKTSSRVLGPTFFIFSGFRFSSSAVTLPGRDFDHSPPASADVKNNWGYSSTPLYTFMERTGTELHYLPVIVSSTAVLLTAVFIKNLTGVYLSGLA
jgi:hypothetical protein